MNIVWHFRGNFPLLFRGLCEVLNTALDEGLNGSRRSSSGSHESGQDLELWQQSCELLTELLEIVQVLNIPRNFQIFLKVSPFGIAASQPAEITSIW